MVTRKASRKARWLRCVSSGRARRTLFHTADWDAIRARWRSRGLGERCRLARRGERERLVCALNKGERFWRECRRRDRCRSVCLVGVFVNNESVLLADFGSEDLGRTVSPFEGLATFALRLSWRKTSRKRDRWRSRSDGSHDRFPRSREKGMLGSDRASGHSLTRFRTDHLADELRERGRKVAFPPKSAGQGPLVFKAGASRLRT